MKHPKIHEWTDAANGRKYFRVRTTTPDGREVSKSFSDEGDAARYLADLKKSRQQHGRGAAADSDEIAGLSLWREFSAAERTAGRDAPSLRDTLRETITRLKTACASVSLDDLKGRYLDAIERRQKSASHQRSVKIRLERFVSYFDAAESADLVTADGVERALASMLAGGLSPQTVKGIRTAAFGMFRWGVKMKLVHHNPVADTDPPTVIVGEVGTITPGQLSALLNSALSVRPQAVPALAVAAFCGVRRAELTRLQWDALDFERRELKIGAAIAKTGTARYIPMPDALIEWLEAAQAAGVAPVGRLIPLKPARDGSSPETTAAIEARAEATLLNWMRVVRRESGILSWPNNALRHSFASYACALHDDFSKVAAWLGHVSDQRLLVDRYRHAVRKDAGAAWFDVRPSDGPGGEVVEIRKGKRRSA